MTLKTRLSILLLSTPVLIFVVVGGLIGRASATEGDSTYQHLRVFEDVLSLVISNYVEEVKVDKAMEGFTMPRGYRWDKGGYYGQIDEQEQQELLEDYGLDKPLFPGQFLDYMGDMLTLNFGQSIEERRQRGFTDCQREHRASPEIFSK